MTATLAVGGCALLYLWGVRRYDRRSGRPFPRAAIAWEALALGTLWIAFAGLDASADGSFAAHMAQHTLLVMLAAPALLLGAPLRLLLGALPRAPARFAASALRSRMVLAITSPAMAWLVFVVVLWGTHYSPLYEAALEQPALHVAEHLVYLASGVLFWSHVFPVAPLPARLAAPARGLYLFLAGPSSAFLGLSLWSAHAVLYPHYAHAQNPWGLSPLDDQRAGGLLMWTAGSVATLVALLAVLAQWARDERAATARREARAALVSLFIVACACAAAPALAAPDGKVLYAVHCASCHGFDLRGGPNAPNIRGVGAAEADWWVGTGRMPAAIPWVQSMRRPPLLSPPEIDAVVSYVVSVAPGGPPIPQVQTGGNLVRGRALFAQNCEHCHGAYGQGTSIGSDYVAPALNDATVTQIGEAVRAGVGMMPKFGPRQLSQAELDDVVTYIDWLRSHPQTPGGLTLSATGPFGEGATAWLIVAIGITGYAWLLGTTTQRADETKEPQPAADNASAHEHPL